MLVKILQVATVAFTCLCFSGSIQSQRTDQAKTYFENARSYNASDDPRAEQEYRRAIAARNGVYPEAWRALASYYSNRLRFDEAASALQTYFEQSQTEIYAIQREELRRLKRAAELKTRSARNDSMTSDEMNELTKLIDQFGTRGDALPYAEKAVTLHPESAKALIALAFLIKGEQRDRAIDLLNRAVAFQPNDPSVYTARGWGYYWCYGDGVQAEADFRRALALTDGTSASAWQGLGDALARQGKKKQAINAYRKYLSIRPKSAAHYDGEIKKSIEALESKLQH